MDISASMIERAVDSINFDPLASIRADYAQLKAHHQMVNDAANARLVKSREAMSEANLLFDEADQIRRQFQFLERQHPELTK